MRTVSAILIAILFLCEPGKAEAQPIDRAEQMLTIVYAGGNAEYFSFWFRDGRIYMSSTNQTLAYREPQEYRPLATAQSGGKDCRELEAEDTDPKGNLRTGSVCVEVQQLSETVWNFHYKIKESGKLYGLEGRVQDEDFWFTLAIGPDDCLLTGVRVSDHGTPQTVDGSKCVGDGKPDIGVERTDKLYEVGIR